MSTCAPSCRSSIRPRSRCRPSSCAASMTASRALTTCWSSSSGCRMPTSNSPSCPASPTPRSSRRITCWSITSCSASFRSPSQSIAAGIEISRRSSPRQRGPGLTLRNFGSGFPPTRERTEIFCARLRVPKRYCSLLGNGNLPEETMLTRRHVLLATALAGIAGLAAPAHSQDAVDVEAAKREGKVVWYTSTPIEQGQKIVDLFQKETGIKVEMFRSGGSAILRRFQQEADAGRIAADVLTTSDPAASAVLTRKGVFVPFKPKDFDKIPEAAKDPNGAYIAQRLNMMTIYLREDKVPEADQPKTWDDLLNPKYKGKMVLTDPSFTALQVSVIGMMSKQRGWGFYEKLQKNDVMVVQGNQQVSDMLKRGERLIAVGALDSYAAEERRAG